MLTIKQITEDTDKVIRGLEKKHFANAKETIAKVLELNDQRRSAQNQLDKNLSEVNSTSKAIGALMKEGKKEEAEAAKARVAEIKEISKELQATMDKAAEDMQNLLYTIPNVPYESVPEGFGAEDNVVEKMGGMETELPKDALPHWELAKKYDLIDFDLGVKITGAGFPVYKGKGARLQRALINFFLDEARAAGYGEIMPPTVVNAASGYGTGQLPDKEGQMYHCNLDDLYLIPTAEVPVTNIYRDVILDEKQLPIKNCAYTQCFRREAGSYGKDVRGLNRLHEFSKVELVRIDKPEHSKQSHQEMLDHVEGLLKKLELPYRILRLCGGDQAFFQQHFVAFIEQFLNFGVLVTIQEPVKIGGVRQFSEWESDHVTDQRSTFKVSKQFRNACDLLGIFVDQRLKETDRSIAQSAGAFV